MHNSMCEMIMSIIIINFIHEKKENSLGKPRIRIISKLGTGEITNAYME